MDLFTLLLFALGLSMDAFAVSISNVLCYPGTSAKKHLSASLCFGLFQGMMPLIGFFAAIGFSSYVRKYDHWITLIVLGFIGIKAIVEAVKDIKNPPSEKICKLLTSKAILLQAVATSIDALAVGVDLALMDGINIWTSAGVIAAVTAVMCVLANFIGSKVSGIFKEKAQIFGGIILVLIGLKIFISDVFM